MKPGLDGTATASESATTMNAASINELSDLNARRTHAYIPIERAQVAADQPDASASVLGRMAKLKPSVSSPHRASNSSVDRNLIYREINRNNLSTVPLD